MKPQEYNKILTGLAEWISGLRDRRPSAGRRLLVESMTADTEEVSEGLQRDVMERVSREIVLDADEGIDYKALADGVQPLLPVELKSPTDSETEACQQLNDALEMGAITKQYTNAEAAVGTLLAGADIVLGPQNFVEPWSRL